MQVYPDTHIYIIKHKIHLWQKELLSPPNISTFRTSWSPVILLYHAFQGLMQTQVHTWRLKLSHPPLFFFHVLPCSWSPVFSHPCSPTKQHCLLQRPPRFSLTSPNVLRKVCLPETLSYFPCLVHSSSRQVSRSSHVCLKCLECHLICHGLLSWLM